MNRIDESFNDAEQICKNYDGNLVIIDTVPEKVGALVFGVFVYSLTMLIGVCASVRKQCLVFSFFVQTGFRFKMGRRVFE